MNLLIDAALVLERFATPHAPGLAGLTAKIESDHLDRLHALTAHARSCITLLIKYATADELRQAATALDELGWEAISVQVEEWARLLSTAAACHLWA